MAAWRTSVVEEQTVILQSGPTWEVNRIYCDRHTKRHCRSGYTLSHFPGGLAYSDLLFIDLRPLVPSS